MDIKQYIRSLLPSFEKSQVMEDIRLLKDSLDSSAKLYKAADKELGKLELGSKYNSDFQKRFSDNIESRARGNYLSVIAVALENGVEALPKLEKMADKTFAEDINVEGMSYFKANLLQYIEALSFAVRYAQKLLILTYRSETNWLEERHEDVGREMKPSEFKWLAENERTFLLIIQLLSDGVKDAERAFDSIPDMTIVEDNIQVVTKTVGKNKIDPFRFGLMPIKLNPIYHVRMAIAEWQVDRMKSAEEERKVLELRLMHLKDLVDGVPVADRNTRLQQQIEYNEGRLDKLNHKLAKMEEDYV